MRLPGLHHRQTGEPRTAGVLRRLPWPLIAATSALVLTAAGVGQAVIPDGQGKLTGCYRLDTTEPGEPLHASVIGGASRWFKLTAAQSGTFEIDTIGSDIDTVLAVYTGSDFATLNVIASDNNSAPDGIRSRVRFAAQSGTDYLVALDGVNGAQGNIQLNWKLGTQPVFTLAPTNQTARQSGSIVLVAGATATPAVSYQWRFNTIAIPGATNAMLTLTNLQFSQAGTYNVVASNFVGSATSLDAVIAVLGPITLGPTSPSFTNGMYKLLVSGLAGQHLVLEATTNFTFSTLWIPIYTNLGMTGILEFIDANSTNYPRRFYRAVERP